MHTNWEKDFDEEIVPILENPLLEYNSSEGYEEPKKCTAVDIGIIKSFTERALTTQKEEIRKVVEGKKETMPTNTYEYLRIGGKVELRNEIIDDILAELNK